MATLQATRTKCDLFINGIMAVLVGRQENFRTNRDRYWQARHSHTNPPTHANGSDGDSVPDRLDEHPEDAFDNWRTAFPAWENAPLPCSIAIHAYDGPDGKGWIIEGVFVHSGVTWKKSVNVGPNNDKTHDWEEQEPIT